MFYKFKKKSSVIVSGRGLSTGIFYQNISGTVVIRDPFFKDYLVKFADGKEEWFRPEALQRKQLKKGA